MYKAVAADAGRDLDYSGRVKLAPAHVDLWPERALIVSKLGEVRRHRHACAALLVGLDGAFELRGPRARVRTRAAFVPAGLEHALDCGDTSMATLYTFALTGETEALAATLGCSTRALAVDLHLPAGLRAWLRGLYDAPPDLEATASALRARLLSGAHAAGGQVDPRVRAALERVRAAPEATTSLAALASELELSPTRLMHLLEAELAAPWRGLRRWERMRVLAAHVGAGESLTTAGLAAGFYDSSHLCRSFRSAFGVPPSRVLHGGSRIRAAAPPRAASSQG